VQDAGDGVGVGDDLEDPHAAAAFSAAGVERKDAGEELCPADASWSGRGRGRGFGRVAGEAKSSGSCGGGGAAGLGMTRSRRRWWLASTP